MPLSPTWSCVFVAIHELENFFTVVCKHYAAGGAQ
jgi:hypothetical protein